MTQLQFRDGSGRWRAVALIAFGVAAGAVLRPEHATGQGRERPTMIDENIYVGVSRGMMVPFFGTTPPDGFIWADGKTNWPPEAWVPKHLQGSPVPDVRKRLVGGALDEPEVGREWDKGKLNPIKVALNPHTVKVAPHPDFPRQNLMGVVSRDTTGRDETFRDDRISLTFARIPVTAYGDPSGQIAIPEVKLDSAETNPRHIMCRWIIRVR